MSKLTFRRSALLIICLAVACTPGLVRAGIVAALLNAGNLQLLDQLATGAPAVDDLFLQEAVAEIPAPLGRALELAPHNTAIRRAMGRAALLAQEFGVAATALTPLSQDASHSPLLYPYLIVTLAYNEQWRDVIRLYEEKTPSTPATPTLDLVALAYLHLAAEARSQGEITTAASLWRAAQSVPSNDFYVRYLAYDLAQQLELAETDATLQTLLATPSSHVRWYPKQDWTARYPPAAFSLVSAGWWSVDGLWGMALQAARAGRWSEAEHLLSAALQQDWATPAVLQAQLAELYRLQEDYTTAAQHLSQAIESDPSNAWLRFELGQTLETQAGPLLQAAVTAYRQAHHLQPADLFTLDRLIQLSSRLGQDAAAAEWQALLLSQASGREPEYPVRDDTWNAEADTIRLRGYDLQETALEWDLPLPLCLWWSGQMAPSEQGLYRLADDSWLQCIHLPNLITNGGFELDSGTGAMIPSGYTQDVYPDTPPAAHGIVFDPSNERQSKVLRLTNDAGRSRSGIISQSITVLGGQRQYLLGAWLRSDGGRAYIGYRGRDTSRTHHLVRDVQPDTWQHFGVVFGLEPNTVELEIRLLNYRANDSTVYLDDLFLVELPLSPAGPNN
ncbi:MAG: tetratricopeptide repeat protein [Chloroflexota bacterium]